MIKSIILGGTDVGVGVALVEWGKQGLEIRWAENALAIDANVIYS